MHETCSSGDRIEPPMHGTCSSGDRIETITESCPPSSCPATPPWGPPGTCCMFRKDANERLAVPIVDTMLLEQGKIRRWVFSSKVTRGQG